MNYLRHVVWFVSFMVVAQMYSCTSIKEYKTGRKVLKFIERSPVFTQYFQGIYLIDPKSGSVIINENGDKYFTPASNTKILTLAAYLSLDIDSIPSFFVTKERELIALADPTFLHPDFPSQNVLGKLETLNTDTLKIYQRVNTRPFGPGWAWDDYSYDFQPERSALPLYGNTVRISKNKNQYNIEPGFFNGYFDVSDKTGREELYNIFTIDEKLDDSTRIDIPFKTSIELTDKLLTDTLFKPVALLDGNPGNPVDTIYNQPVLPVLSIMMQRSDNFLAEQLLLNAQAIYGFADQEVFIEFINNSLYTEIENIPIWVDGSGLSRYNMVTPRTMVDLLQKIYEELEWQQIETIFPTGGKSGTIRYWYKADEPYVFAKTGTLRHNHNLSGYIRSRSGKVYIFSFMNNHYPFTSSSVAKKEMEKVLELLRDNLD